MDFRIIKRKITTNEWFGTTSIPQHSMIYIAQRKFLGIFWKNLPINEGQSAARIKHVFRNFNEAESSLQHYAKRLVAGIGNNKVEAAYSFDERAVNKLLARLD